LVRKVLTTVKDWMDKDTEKYRTFWREFGRAVKEGFLEDPDNRDTILDIASFASTHDPKEQTTLREYVGRMKDGQSEIYFLSGESRAAVENSPHLEAFVAKGYEVLILTDPVDGLWPDRVGTFDGKPLRSVALGRIDLDPGKDDDGGTEDFAGLLDWLGTTLADEVKQVRLSSRLTTSPACLVGDDHDITPALEKLYRASGQELPKVKRILELNPGHPLVIRLREAHERGDDPDGLAATARLIHGMALLAEGGELGDPAAFARLLAERLTSTL
jgi:molecular chaperone HtpG